MSARLAIAANALALRVDAALVAANELLADVVEANKKADPRSPSTAARVHPTKEILS